MTDITNKPVAQQKDEKVVKLEEEATKIFNKEKKKIRENAIRDVYGEDIRKKALKERTKQLADKAKRRLRAKHRLNYQLKIKYKIPKFNDKVYTYIGKQNNNFVQIEVGDTVKYINKNHQNHNEKGIVRKHVKSGGTYSNPRVEFEVIFNDPPFLTEINPINQKKYKTKKKIKVIKNIPFQKLRKIGNINKFKVKLPIKLGKEKLTDKNLNKSFIKDKEALKVLKKLNEEKNIYYSNNIDDIDDTETELEKNLKKYNLKNIYQEYFGNIIFLFRSYFTDKDDKKLNDKKLKEKIEKNSCPINLENMYLTTYHDDFDLDVLVSNNLALPMFINPEINFTENEIKGVEKNKFNDIFEYIERPQEINEYYEYKRLKEIIKLIENKLKNNSNDKQALIHLAESKKKLFKNRFEINNRNSNEMEEKIKSYEKQKKEKEKEKNIIYRVKDEYNVKGIIYSNKSILNIKDLIKKIRLFDIENKLKNNKISLNNLNLTERAIILIFLKKLYYFFNLIKDTKYTKDFFNLLTHPSLKIKDLKNKYFFLYYFYKFSELTTKNFIIELNEIEQIKNLYESKYFNEKDDFCKSILIEKEIQNYMENFVKKNKENIIKKIKNLNINLSLNVNNLNNLDILVEYLKGVIIGTNKIKESTITRKDYIEQKINQLIRKNFYRGSEIFPTKVPLKYTSLINDKKYRNYSRSKMVEPTDNKVYILKRSPKLQLLDNNKLFKITKTSSDDNYGEIEIFLIFDINIQNTVDNINIVNENQGQRTVRLIGNIFDSIRDNFDCSDLKKNIINDMSSISKAIVKRINQAVKPDNIEKNNSITMEKPKKELERPKIKTKLLNPNVTVSEIYPHDYKEEGENPVEMFTDKEFKQAPFNDATMDTNSSNNTIIRKSNNNDNKFDRKKYNKKEKKKKQNKNNERDMVSRIQARRQKMGNSKQ